VSYEYPATIRIDKVRAEHLSAKCSVIPLSTTPPIVTAAGRGRGLEYALDLSYEAQFWLAARGACLFRPRT